MKLLLTSDGWKENQKIKQEFLRLTNKELSKTNILIVNTAIRGDDEWKYVELHLDMLRRVGFKSENIKIFSLNRRLKERELSNIDIIYVCGGNTFHYMDKMKKTGFDNQIKGLCKKNTGYFGISAGSIVAGPNINIAKVGIADAGDKNDIGLKGSSGLGLTDIIIYPHYSDEEETVVKKFEKKNKCKVFRLTDKQALLIQEKSKRIIG